MKKTHTDERVVETFVDGKGVTHTYPVRRRTPEETARLVRLRDRLSPERVFTYSCTPKGKRVDLNFPASSLREAAEHGRAALDVMAS